MTFDPTTHTYLPERQFFDFSIGEIFRAPSRTMTEGIFAAFQVTSGDNHPSHYDREYCKHMGHPDLWAHGLQTLAQAAIGATPLPHQMGANLIGFLEQSCRFLKPVYCGDTLYTSFEITNLEPRNTTGVMTLAVAINNQTGELVLEGEQKYLLRLGS